MTGFRRTIHEKSGKGQNIINDGFALYYSTTRNLIEAVFTGTVTNGLEFNGGLGGIFVPPTTNAIISVVSTDNTASEIDKHYILIEGTKVGTIAGTYDRVTQKIALNGTTRANFTTQMNHVQKVTIIDKAIFDAQNNFIIRKLPTGTLTVTHDFGGTPTVAATILSTASHFINPIILVGLDEVFVLDDLYCENGGGTSGIMLYRDGVEIFRASTTANLNVHVPLVFEEAGKYSFRQLGVGTNVTIRGAGYSVKYRTL